MSSPLFPGHLTMEEPMPSAPPVDRLARALDATDALIVGVRDDQWSNPTPCPKWNVRTLVNHLVVGNLMFARILSGERLEDLRRLRAIDHLGDDLSRVYRESGRTLQAAFSQSGVLERVIQVPVGTVRATVAGTVALDLRITDLLVHGWDLARATRQPARLPEDLAEEELAFARGESAPDVPRTGQPFGPAQSIFDDAAAIDQLAAYLGRVDVQPSDIGE